MEHVNFAQNKIRDTILFHRYWDFLMEIIANKYRTMNDEISPVNKKHRSLNQQRERWNFTGDEWTYRAARAVVDWTKVARFEKLLPKKGLLLFLVLIG